MTKVTAILALVLALVFHGMSGIGVAEANAVSGAEFLSGQADGVYSSIVATVPAAHSPLPEAPAGTSSAGVHCTANCAAILPNAVSYLAPRSDGRLENPSLPVAGVETSSHFRPPIL